MSKSDTNQNDTPDNPSIDYSSTPEQIVQSLYGDGKPLFFVVIAVQIASMAGAMPKMLRQMIGREKADFEFPEASSVSEWASLYANPRRLKDAMGRLLFGKEFETSLVMQEHQQFVHLPEDDIRAQVEKGLAEDPDMFKGLLVAFQGVEFPPDLETVRSMINDLDALSEAPPEPSGELKESDDSVECPTELSFFLQVWFPCYVLHKTYPSMLMRKARKGCDESLLMLLRLDKSVIFDPVLAPRWHAITRGNDRALRKRVLKAMTETPKGRIDAKRVRYMLAGYISQVATAFKCPVTAPEIAQLFDTVAQIQSKGSSLIDEHIAGAESFTRRIFENRNWPSLPPNMPGR